MKSNSKSQKREREQMEKPSPRASRKRILLVDDDASVRGSLQDMLVAEGYLVISASDGQQALELIAASSIDLVLLDLNMPRKNGWDTFERLSAEHPLVPVILITARSNQLFTALGAGVGALLEKPLDIPHLLTTIGRLLTESSEVRFRRLAGLESPFDYQPSRRGPKNPRIESADIKP